MATAISVSDPRQTTPALLVWGARYLRPYLTAITVVALSVMLVFTIYHTLLDLQWIAFLLGVLFAALLSMVSQSVKAQWRLVRRSAQLRRSRELLAEEAARSERAAQALKTADQRFRTVLDALPALIFFMDREERCRYHNRAFEAWCARPAADIGGAALSALLDAEIYETLKAHIAKALLGTEAQFETQWLHPDGVRHVTVKLLPYPVGAQTTSGFYVFVTVVAVARARSAAESSAQDALITPEAVYLDEMAQQLTAEEDPREYLLRALEEDRFTLLEQNIESLAPETGDGNFREILLRLREEEERTLPPGGFFEVAERYDLMPAIDRWVIRKLLKSCALMKSADSAWRVPLCCLNVSGATLADRSFAAHVRAQLEHWEIAGSRLCFEIAHGALADRETDISALMQELKPLGCRFTVDCFGSDKVSFAPFTRLPFDFIKIDRSIVCEILRNKSELARARAIVLACRKIGVRTIAHFVEDEATRVKLKDIGVDYVQGFGIAQVSPWPGSRA